MMKIQVICENCDKTTELTPKTVGNHASVRDLESDFRISEVRLDYDRNVDDIDEVEATVDELRIDCANCGNYIVLNDFDGNVYHYHR